MTKSFQKLINPIFHQNLFYLKKISKKMIATFSWQLTPVIKILFWSPRNPLITTLPLLTKNLPHFTRRFFVHHNVIISTVSRHVGGIKTNIVSFMDVFEWR